MTGHIIVLLIIIESFNSLVIKSPSHWSACVALLSLPHIRLERQQILIILFWTHYFQPLFVQRASMFKALKSGLKTQICKNKSNKLLSSLISSSSMHFVYFCCDVILLVMLVFLCCRDDCQFAVFRAQCI